MRAPNWNIIRNFILDRFGEMRHSARIIVRILWRDIEPLGDSKGRWKKNEGTERGSNRDDRENIICRRSAVLKCMEWRPRRRWPMRLRFMCTKVLIPDSKRRRFARLSIYA